jgi:hypothetical protein
MIPPVTPNPTPMMASMTMALGEPLTVVYRTNVWSPASLLHSREFHRYPVLPNSILAEPPDGEYFLRGMSRFDFLLIVFTWPSSTTTTQTS